MTNLSELLPSGGGAKEFSAIASGTLPSGQTVALKSDGKVEAVGTTSQAIGATNQWATSASTQPSATAYGSVYDPDSQRVVVAYYDGNDNYYGYCVAGEVDPSNNTITFGTQVLFQSNFIIPHSIGYDTTNDKIVVFFQNVNSSSHGQAKVGTFTGSTLSFPGSEATFNAGSTEDITAVFNPDQGTFLVVYKDNANSGRPMGAVGTVSGTSISFGSETQLDSNGTSYIALTYNTTTSSYVMVYNKTSVTQQTYYQMPTTSGTTVTAGTPTLMTLNGSTTSQVKYTNLSSDNASNTVFLTFANEYDSNHAHAIAATISGSTLTFGTEVEFSANTTYGIGAVYDTSAKKLVVSYADTNQYGIVVVASVSGTTLTFGSPTTFRNSSTNSFTNAYDSVNKKVVVTYYEQNTGYAGSVVFQPESSNASGFIGITSQAIANTATGKVNPQGGVATASSPSSGEAGTAVVFTGNIASNDTVAVFDSSSNQVVIGFQNASTGGGQAIVADLTASTNAVTLGSAGSYQSAGGASYNAITYDASANKIVSICSALASPFQGVAYVGTVSGTSISYTGAVNFNGTENYQGGDLTYDSSNNVTVVSFERNDSGSNKHGASVVGTISGGAITFGTASDFAPSTNIQYANNTFDSNSNKVVTVFQNSSTGYGNAVVGTVSGTTISHGSLGVLTTNGVEMGTGGTICFDSTNNKVIAPYRNTTDSKGYVRIGTVSGTTITFGSAVEFDSAPGGQSIRSVYDSNLNKVIIFYTDSSNYPTVRTGTVSGTSIVLDDAFTVATTTVTTDMSCAAAFDSSENRTLLSYKPSATGLGNAQVYLTAGTPQDLIVGSTYYVQNNGNLSTTSSSVTAGKAISTTQLILNGAS